MLPEQVRINLISLIKSKENTVDTKVPMKKIKNEYGDVEEVIDWTKIDTGIKFDGKQITLPGDPENMPYKAAIETIQRIEAAENQTYDVVEKVPGLPWDALASVYKAMVEIYGVALPTTIHGWFRKVDPQFVTIKTGYRDSDVIQVPVGQITLPGMKSPVNLQYDAKGAVLVGNVNSKGRARLVEIAALAKKILKTDSIYKGKAIKLLVNDRGDLDVREQPEFYDIRDVKETDMIHNYVTADIIETTIFAPIKHTNECRKHRIPLKRGILLEGKYGTGKTLTARVTAKVATDNNWTFIILSRSQGLLTALSVAKTYQPSILFAEDIDRAVKERATKEATNDLINALDGMIPAGAELMVVLTTNHVEQIDRALLRPGRLDAVISIDAPDAHTVERLVRHYGGDHLDADEVSLVKTGDLLAGQIPATVAEVVKRAKLTMLTYGRATMQESDLVTAAESMKRHLKLLDETPTGKTNAELLEDSFKTMFDNTDNGQLSKNVKEMFQMLAEIKEYMEN